jgi:hypothetical protein
MRLTFALMIGFFNRKSLNWRRPWFAPNNSDFSVIHRGAWSSWPSGKLRPRSVGGNLCQNS